MTWVRGLLGGMRVRILAVVVLVLTISSLGSVLLLRAALLDQLDDEVSESLAREAQEFRLLADGNDPRTGRPFDGDLEAIFEVYFSREVPDEGESLLAFVDGRLVAARRAQDAAAPDQLGAATTYWLSLTEEERGTRETVAGPAEYVALPLTGSDGEQGLFVVANFPAFEREEIADSLQTQQLISLLALLLATTLGAVLAGRVLRPLVVLASTAREISETDLSRRIPTRGGDEASQIAEAFNDMLGRLEEAFTSQRRFLDDTSHELRTPLTVIRGQVELLELDETPEERAETTRLVLDELDRLSRMVDDLFLLARAEHPDFLRPDRVEVATFLADLHRRLSTLTPLALAADVPDDLVVTADPHRLAQAVTQLVANAVKHAGPEPGIELGGRVEGRYLLLWVSDDGPGVSIDDAPHVFDRSRRGAGAQRDGAGLGLAIVRAIAVAHGGTARLAPTAAGARFELRLPLGTPSSQVAPHVSAT